MSVDPVRFAKFFATTKHAAQLYGSVPYTHHLAAVEMVIRRFRKEIYNDFGGGQLGDVMFGDLLTAAWLHDVCEDTETKLKEIVELFGEDVAELVDAVTKVKAENRKVSALLTYPKTRKVIGGVTLKLADRIANVENGGKLVEMYRKEYEDFRRALYSPGKNEAMWAHLDLLLATDPAMEKKAGDA